jgi:hypothetical protein
VTDRDGVRAAVGEAVGRVSAGILGLPAIGPHDSFFDLGARSLAVARIAAQLWSVFGADVLEVLFERPTVAGLTDHSAAEIEAGRASAPPVCPAPRRSP